ncbi:hypothetical protein L8C07_24705 [Paenibacillus sp. CMAA1739]|uniref:hypothetical protein n=1 Tax=Paenibacillus TaxID=44249 RepID=UPI000AB9CE2D|nr:hypothetical protein [Paenibacillus jamilae]MEC4569150.1 hypothetical protein [Paenibacillus sp. CMAA1739]
MNTLKGQAKSFGKVCDIALRPPSFNGKLLLLQLFQMLCEDKFDIIVVNKEPGNKVWLK